MSDRLEQFFLLGSLKACRPVIPVDTMVGDEYTLIYENCFLKYKAALFIASELIDSLEKVRKGVPASNLS